MNVSNLLATMDALWWYVWHLTDCADCAQHAANGEPWDKAQCWAQHRAHVAFDATHAIGGAS